MALQVIVLITVKILLEVEVVCIARRVYSYAMLLSPLPYLLVVGGGLQVAY